MAGVLALPSCPSGLGAPGGWTREGAHVFLPCPCSPLAVGPCSAVHTHVGSLGHRGSRSSCPVPHAPGPRHLPKQALSTSSVRLKLFFQPLAFPPRSSAALEPAPGPPGPPRPQSHACPSFPHLPHAPLSAAHAYWPLHVHTPLGSKAQEGAPPSSFPSAAGPVIPSLGAHRPAPVIDPGPLALLGSWDQDQDRAAIGQ